MPQLQLNDPSPRGSRPHPRDRVERRIDVGRLGHIGDVGIDAIEVDRHVRPQFPGEPQIDVLGLGVPDVMVRDEDIGRRRGCKCEGILSTIGIRVRWIPNRDVRLAEGRQLVSESSLHEVLVVQTVRGPHHRPAVATHIPRNPGARSDVIVVGASFRIPDQLGQPREPRW